MDALRDDGWARLRDLVPGGRAGQRGPRCDNRLFVDTLLWMARSGARWRDLPERFGEHQAVKRRTYRWIARGALGGFLTALTADADLEWLMIDSTIVRAHQHAAGARVAKGGLMLRAPTFRASTLSYDKLPANDEGFVQLAAIAILLRQNRRTQLVVATLAGRAVAMAGRRRSDRALRGRLKSPGRPPVARQTHRRQFWALIAKGLSSGDTAMEVGVSPPVGGRWFREAGGMAPAHLSESSGRYLSFVEREEIALWRAQGLGVREVARRLGRSASTVSRELRRNSATRSGNLDYLATIAQWHAERSARRPKQAKLAANPALRTYVQDRLAGAVVAPGGIAAPGPAEPWKGRRHGRRQNRRRATAWSLQQIAERLRLDFPGDTTMRISHEAIYQAPYIQGRGALKRELTACLRTVRALRVPRERARGRGKSFITPEVLVIERPAEAADRAVPGHWERDLILGLNSSAIGTLVERTTRFTMLLHLPSMPGHGDGPREKNGPALAGHGAAAVRDAIAHEITTLPEHLRRSLTWDQGAEMAQHSRLRIDTGLAVYFCDPHSPWPRGTNENTNGLLRQYFPKGTHLGVYGPDDLAAVAAALDGRPRKTLGWKTPAEAFNAVLQSVQAGVATTS